MNRRSKRLQSISNDIANSTQTRLDSEFGVKSSILIKDPSKSDSNSKFKNDSIKTRSMTKLYLNSSNNEKLIENVTTKKEVKPMESEISSPKKKSKIKQGCNKKNNLNENLSYLNKEKQVNYSTEKNKIEIEEHKDSKINYIIDEKEIGISEENDELLAVTKSGSQLDEFLPPTAPESQISSPLKTEKNQLKDVNISDFADKNSIYIETQLDNILNKEFNSNSSTYDEIIKNKILLQRLRKIPLPQKYEYLISIFQGLEIVLRLLERRQKPFFYPSLIREQVENVTKKVFSMDNLLRILWIAPQLISVKWCKTDRTGFSNLSSPLNKKKEFSDGYELEIVLKQGLNNSINRLSHSNINERMDILRLIFLDFVLIQQENHLRKVITKTINTYVNLSDLKCWSSFFNIDNCVDIPKAKLPCKNINNYNSIEKIRDIDNDKLKKMNSTPNLRNLYRLKFVSSLSTIEEHLEKEKKDTKTRRSISADNTKSEVDQKDNSKFQTPARSKKAIYELENEMKENNSINQFTDSSQINIYSTPRRSIRSSDMLSRSISPSITSSPLNTPLYTKLSKSVGIYSRNRNILTPSQKELLESVKRREKIKEISNLINIEDDEYNNKLENIKNELWTVQQISFIFLNSKKIIPTTQIPLLAKRLTTYARNCPEIDQVQESIIRLSYKWPDYIKLGNSTIDKGVKLVKLQLDDNSLSEIIKNLTKEKNLIIKQREEFRLNTIANYQQ